MSSLPPVPPSGDPFGEGSPPPSSWPPPVDPSPLPGGGPSTSWGAPGGQPSYGQPQFGQPQYGQSQGYGPPGYGQAPGYGPPGMGYRTQDHPQGTTVLVLGILGLVLCQILGPIAWIMGNRAIREIDASPGMYGNRGAVQAGRVCGIIATVIMALFFLFILFALVVGARSSPSTY